MTPKLSGPMVLPRDGDPRSLVVLLHGYGSNGQDLIGLVPMVQPALPDAMFVAPNAPTRSRMLGAGYEWFDLSSWDLHKLAREAEAARPIVEAFLRALWDQTGLGAADTLLVGFSQGTIMALEVGLTLDTPVAGIVGFSGLLAGMEGIAERIRSRPPICLIHGTADNVVPYQASVLAADALKAAGLSATLHTSAGAGHTISNDGLEAALEFGVRALGHRRLRAVHRQKSRRKAPAS